MLVNLRIKPGQRTKWQKFCRKLLRDTSFDGWDGFRKATKLKKNHFNFIIHPYSPCGLEYEKDTLDKFTGVYVDTFDIAENWLSALTYNKSVHTLIGYGCVDNASQAVEEYEKLKKRCPEDVIGNHIILLTPIFKKNAGGFRWHKHGYYSGKAPAGGCEYFANEPCADLKMIYTYNIIQVSEPKEEDFGDVEERNIGRVPSIRKLRMMGLTNLAAYAKTCGYVACGDAGCWTMDGDTEMYFRFEEDGTVTPRPDIIQDKTPSVIPDVDWSK